MNVQLYEVTLFDQAPALGGQPRYVVQIHFSELAHQKMSAKRETPNSVAREIARNLTRHEWGDGPGGSRITHPLMDLDTLGAPTAYPDDAGSRAWVAKVPESQTH